MCGICGFVDGLNGARVEDDVLGRMNDALIHRGPDDQGRREAPPVHLAMRRLSIVDPASGQQPVRNEDDTIWAVFNGEIYNHQELRRDLIARGHRFLSDHSDSETIVHLYEEYGDDWPSLAKVNGMFAVAVWDANRRCLILYRDRLGKKPLYWAKVGNGIAFASEPKSLLCHPLVPRALDPAAIWHYFSLKSVPGPFSVWKGLHQLPPGSRLTWMNGSTTIESWWRPDFTPGNAPMAAEECNAEILRLLDDAVGLRMQADVPLGVFLSGGLDSSAVACLVRRRHAGTFKTFFLSYTDGDGAQFEGKSNDAKWSRHMAERLGTEHHELVLSAQAFINDLPAVMRAFDEPFSGTVSTFYLAGLIRQHIPAAVSGDGADELFGSYLAHRLAIPMDRYLSHGNQPWDDDARAGLAPFHSAERFAYLAEIADRDQAMWRMRLAVFNEQEKASLLSAEMVDARSGADTLALYRRLLDTTTATDALNAALELDQRSLLPDQVLAFCDRLSMAHGLEIRSPFLDFRLVDFVNRLPGSLKIRNETVKHALKQAVHGLLPDEVIQRPKEGFVQPVYGWMRGKLRPWLEGLLAPDRLASHGMLRQNTVDRLLAEHFGGQADHGAKLWNLACFQVWYETIAADMVRS